MKTAERILTLALLATMVTVEAQQARYKMTTSIPVSITTPDKVETSLGTLRFFDGFPDAVTIRTVYDNPGFLIDFRGKVNNVPR